MQAETSPSTPTSFSLARTLRLGTFHIGSAMGDILVTSIWNRVMIANLGVPAWPVSLLIALRYLLSPISVWAGYRSDARPLWGLRRTYYVWFGRFLMVFSLPFLGLSLGRLGVNQADPLGWLLAFSCFVLYGVGSLTSGSPFLALVRDSAPLTKQGLAISIVETMLIIFYATMGIAFGRWMEVYDPATFWQLIVTTMTVGGLFWFLAILGVERRTSKATPAAAAASPPALAATFGRIWQDARTRRFFLFLGLATFSAWVQDAILEPYGAEVFHLDV
ncbi:MAG: PucC family protein, partial [Chloroflexota bacterium]